MPSTEPSELVELAAELLALRKARDTCKQSLDGLRADIAAAEAYFASVLAENGLERLVHRGRTFTVGVREAWTVRPGRQPEVVALLKANAPAIVRESVHPATLTCFLRDRR